MYWVFYETRVHLFIYLFIFKKVMETKLIVTTITTTTTISEFFNNEISESKLYF